LEIFLTGIRGDTVCPVWRFLPVDHGHLSGSSQSPIQVPEAKIVRRHRVSCGGRQLNDVSVQSTWLTSDLVAYTGLVDLKLSLPDALAPDQDSEDT